MYGTFHLSSYLSLLLPMAHLTLKRRIFSPGLKCFKCNNNNKNNICVCVKLLAVSIDDDLYLFIKRGAGNWNGMLYSL